MPLPTPKGKTSKEKFLSSCMANTVMNKEFPNNSQRYAVCQSQWKRSKKRKQSKGDLSEPDFNENDLGRFIFIP